MYVVASSVLILFILIFLGYFVGKKQIIRQDCTPDLSNFILKVAMPVTVFLSIVEQEGSGMMSQSVGMVLAVFLLHAITGLFGLLAVHALPIPKQEKGIWIYTCMLSNNGFMGLPLALSIFGNKGLFLMALANLVTNLIIFSVGIKLLTMYSQNVNSISVKKMFINNINIAVVLGFLFYSLQIPLPDVFEKLLTYISNMTSGLSMIVVGLSLSRMAFRSVFEDKKMFLLAALRLLAVPLVVILILKVLPIHLDRTLESILILTAALPASSAQSMITEQYRTNTTAAGRAVFITTLFSVVTVPLIMMVAI